MRDLMHLGWMPADDFCWLDCPEPGNIKLHRGREIVLCVHHAILLEAGRIGSSYSGAHLPPDSRAAEWPWQPARVIDPVALVTA